LDPFQDCLKKGRLREIQPDPQLVDTELRAAQAELDRARTRYASGAWADVILQSYFGVYRAAQAALRARGYRDTNLFALTSALQRLYLDEKQLPDDTVRWLRDAKEIKDLVYEGGRGSQYEAQSMLAWALSFTRAVFGLLARPDFPPQAINPSLPTVRERRPRRGGPGSPRR